MDHRYQLSIIIQPLNTSQFSPESHTHCAKGLGDSQNTISVEEELPIDQTIFLDISGFSSEETFFWLFEAEGDSGEDVGNDTDQAERRNRTGVSFICALGKWARLTSSGWRTALAVDPGRRSTRWASIPKKIRRAEGR